MAGIRRTGRNWGTKEGSNLARELRGWGALLQFGTRGRNGGQREGNHTRENLQVTMTGSRRDGG
jgi:hypothetical protein